MITVTFTADEKLVKAARAQAEREGTSLEELCRAWLKQWVRPPLDLARYDEVIEKLAGTVRVGRKLTRDEMNER
jgi:hypothetical protein